MLGWRLGCACVAIALLCMGAHASPVFANGTGGYACFRIPAIVRTPAGTLLAFAEARRINCRDFGDVRIVLRRSRNSGKTWSALQTVADNGALQAGNPAPVVDTSDPQFPHGRIFLFYCTGDAPEAAVMEGKGSRQVWYRTSVDDGLSWAPPVEITASVTLPFWRAYATGPGHALQLRQGPHAGRIVVAAYHSEGDPRPDGRSYRAHTFFSDDHGRTWRMGASLNAPGSNESTVAEDANGEVVMNSRDQGGSHLRILSFSKDGGAHWETTSLAHDLPDPECEGSMTGYVPAKGAPVLLFSNAANPAARTDLTISVSRDGGRTWPRRKVVYAGPAAYSDIVVMPKARLGILFERGGDGIVFVTHPIKLD